MKKSSVLITTCFIATSFICAPAIARSPKAIHKNTPSCPANMTQGDCGDFTEGYLNGIADRGVGERNVFANAVNSDAYQLGYEKGWKSGRDWE
jgi:hypothetical protein